MSEPDDPGCSPPGEVGEEEAAEGGTMAAAHVRCTPGDISTDGWILLKKWACAALDGQSNANELTEAAKAYVVEIGGDWW